MKAKEEYDKSHLVQCMASATTILSLFDLYRRTFSDSHVVLSLAYSIYTAASIFLLEIQALKYAAPGTLDKLNFCILALERVKVSNPVMSTALSLIYQELQKLQIDIHITLSAPGPDDTEHQQNPQPQTHSHQQSQSPPIGTEDTSHHVLSPIHLHQSYHHSARAAMGTPTGTPAPGTPTPMIPSYNDAFQQPVGGFDLSHTADAPQMPPTHLLGGMSNAVMTIGDPSSYEITPEVFEAFSYAQPITTNMAPVFDPGWAGHPQ